MIDNTKNTQISVFDIKIKRIFVANNVLLNNTIMKKLLLLAFVLCSSLLCRAQEERVILGDEQTSEYFPILKDKRIAIFSNHTGMIGDKHLLDILLENKFNVVAIFSPEHGFRGDADAGEHVSSSVDKKTGVPILSLYDGKSGKPSEASMRKFDILVVDIQDVGLRFYTYYASMCRLMDACAEYNRKVLILDRPNPAMAGVHYGDLHAKAENQVFLYWDSGSYRAIPVSGNAPILPAGSDDAFVEHICVNPAGARLEGYPKGSVRAELSAAAVAEKIRPVFSEEQTPTLYAALEGDLSRLTPASLLAAAETDTALQPVADETIKQFCVMLHTLYCLYFAEHINLYGFGFTPEHLEQIRKAAAEFAGKDFAQAIILCPIGERYHFLSGCTYLIQTGFYQRGGLCS